MSGTSPDHIDQGPASDQTRRSLRRAAFLTAAVGLAFCVLFVTSIALMVQVPLARATDSQLVAYYSSSARVLPVAVGLYLLPFAGIAFIWFVVALRLWAAASAARLSPLLSNVQLISGILFVALMFAAAAAMSVLAVSLQFAEGKVDPVVARQFPLFGSTVILFFAMRMAAMFVFTTSSLGRTAHILPGWFVWIGYAVGLFLLLSAVFSPFLILVFPAWVLVLCLFLILRARSIPADAEVPAWARPIEPNR